MEIGRTRTPRRISSNASKITPPANKSMERFVGQALHIRHTLGELVITTKRCQQFLTYSHKYLLYLQNVTRTKGAQNLALMETVRPGCNKTKGAVRKGGTIIIIIIIVTKRKLEQEIKGCWYQK